VAAALQGLVLALPVDRAFSARKHRSLSLRDRREKEEIALQKPWPGLSEFANPKDMQLGLFKLETGEKNPVWFFGEEMWD
jgi:hypothetical protein